MSGTRLTRALQATAQEVGSSLFFVLEQLGRVLPPRAFLRLDACIGSLLRPPRTKSRGLPMMKAMLGAGRRTEAEWEELWNLHVRLVGQLALRQILWVRTPVAKLYDELEVHGEELIRDVLDAGTGAVLLCSHTGLFMAQLIVAGSMGREVWSFGNPLPSRRAEASFKRFHQRIGVNRRPVGQGHSAGVADLLHRRGMVVSFCDMTTVPRNNAWVRFGETETIVNLGPPLLGLRNQAPLFVLTSRSLSSGRTKVRVHPGLPAPGTGDLLRDAYYTACEAMAIVTDEVQNCPEQWWQWDVGRYRTVNGRQFKHLAPLDARAFKRAVP